MKKMNDEAFTEAIIRSNGMENISILDIQGDYAISVEKVDNDTREYSIYKRIDNGLMVFVADSFNLGDLMSKLKSLSQKEAIHIEDLLLNQKFQPYRLTKPAKANYLLFSLEEELLSEQYLWEFGKPLADQNGETKAALMNILKN